VNPNTDQFLIAAKLISMLLVIYELVSTLGTSMFKEQTFDPESFGVFLSVNKRSKPFASIH
jgi:hypothetical protein